MGDKSQRKENSSELEAQVAAELDASLFGDLEDPLEDDKNVLPTPSKPKQRPVKPKNYEDIWRETATENIDAAADTLAAVADSDRRKWLAFLVEALEKRIGPESLDCMKTLIEERRRKEKG